MGRTAKTREAVSRSNLDSVQPLKQCTQCKNYLVLREFYAKREAKDGLQSRCKTCARTSSREWMASNPEVGKAWAAAHPEKVLEKSCRWRAKHPKKQQACGKRWYEANREKRATYNRLWSGANHEKRALSEKRRNPDKRKAKDHRRRAKVAAIGGSFTSRDIEHIGAMQCGKCCYCGRLGQTLQIEHIIPVTREGSSNDPWNLALACRKCNCSKQDKLLEEWIDRWYLQQR